MELKTNINPNEIIRVIKDYDTWEIEKTEVIEIVIDKIWAKAVVPQNLWSRYEPLSDCFKSYNEAKQRLDKFIT